MRGETYLIEFDKQNAERLSFGEVRCLAVLLWPAYQCPWPVMGFARIGRNLLFGTKRDGVGHPNVSAMGKTDLRV